MKSHPSPGRPIHSRISGDLLRTVAEACHAAPNLDTALAVTLELMCLHLGWSVGHAFTVGPEGDITSTGAWFPGKPGSRFDWFRDATERAERCPGRCLVGRVVRTGEPCWIPDLSQVGDFCRPCSRRSVLRSGFAFPVRVRADVVAVLECYSEHEEGALPELESVLGAVGFQLGLVAQREAVTRELERSREHLLVLSETGEVFARSLDVWDTVRGVADVLARRLGDVCAVLVEDEGEAVRGLWLAGSETVLDEPIDLEGRTLEPSSPLTRAANTGEVLQETPGPEGTLRLPLAEVPGALPWSVPAGAWLAVPLGAGSRSAGAMAVARAGSCRPFSGDEVRVLREVAQRTARAVHNAEIFRKAERSVVVRDEVLAMVAHDLGRPVGAVRMSLARMLNRSPPDDRRVETRRYMEVLSRSVDQMTRLIEDLLDIRRIETGHFTVEARPFPLSPLIQEALDQLRPEVRMQGVVVTDIPRDMDVRADPQRFVQLLGNLLENALRYTPPEGRVTVTARDQGDHVRVSVTDQGPGIDPGRIPLIFDRFHTGRSDRVSGTGLGLTIAREIVEGHGGRIGVESGAKGGSTFFFTLPHQAPPGEVRDPGFTR